jgi:hypothetical protein
MRRKGTILLAVAYRTDTASARNFLRDYVALP